MDRLVRSIIQETRHEGTVVRLEPASGCGVGVPTRPTVKAAQVGGAKPCNWTGRGDEGHRGGAGLRQEPVSSTLAEERQ